MCKPLWIFVLLFPGTASMDLFAQVCLHRKNQYDADCKKHGYWVEYSKSDPQKKTFKGWYDHGNETKKCIYYADGVKCFKLRYVNDSLMRIKRFDADGNPEYKGSALLLTKNNELRFCWDGKFVFYAPHRHRIKKVAYILGEEQDLE